MPPRLQDELTVDFSAGMFDSVALTSLPRTAARLIMNGRIQEDGTVRRRPGTKRTHASVTFDATGFGGIDFHTAAGVHVMVVFFGDKAFRSLDEGVTWSQIATGLREDYYTFVVMRVGSSVYLYAANGDATVKRYDGTTWDTNPNAPAGVRFIAEFNGRLIYFGHDGIRLQGTKIGDPSVLATPDGWLVQIHSHDASSLNGMFTIGEHLLVWDRHQTALVDGYGEQTLIVAEGSKSFSRSVGNVAFRSAVAVGDSGVAWLSDRGVEYYTPRQGIVLVTKSVEGFLKTIDWIQIGSNPGRPSAVWDDVEQNLHLALPTGDLRNNRTLVLNLRQNVENQRKGQLAAATIDRQLSETSGLLTFGDDPEGYLSDVQGGSDLITDGQGYAELAPVATGGEPTGVDGEGYLDSITDDTLPASLFVAHVINTNIGRSNAIYSLGYDGFVRRHHGVDKDDVLSDGSGGVEVTMTIRRPFVMRRPRQRKKARIVHLSSLQDVESEISVLVRGGGRVTPTETVTMPPVTDDDPVRKRAKVVLVSDAPEVELFTSDDVRVSMMGLSARLLRERS